jgi:hypothetical protein
MKRADRGRKRASQTGGDASQTDGVPPVTQHQVAAEQAEGPGTPSAEDLQHYVSLIMVMILSGEWSTGGTLELLPEGLGGRQVDVTISPAEWTVLAKLIRAAIFAARWSGAFVKPGILIQALKDHGVTPTPPKSRTVHDLISSLRSKIAATEIHKVVGRENETGKEFAARLIDSVPRLGYRIALPQKGVRLFVDDMEIGGGN